MYKRVLCELKAKNPLEDANMTGLDSTMCVGGFGGSGVSLTLCCFVVYSTRRFVVCLSVCHFVVVFFSPFSIAITSLGEERANLSAFRTFVRFVLVWICRFPLPLGVWDGLRFVIVALPGLFSYLLFSYVTLVLSLFVPHLCFFWWLGEDCAS